MRSPLEPIQPGDWDGVQRLVDLLSRLLIDVGGRSIGVRFGSGTLTFPGGSPSTSTVTVNHGLGRTPVAVCVCNEFLGSIGSVNTLTSTTFQTLGFTVDGSSPGAGTGAPFYWIAIG